jgi:glutamate synthase domain-containing protein 2
VFVHDVLVGYGLKDKIKLIASGKLQLGLIF